MRHGLWMDDHRIEIAVINALGRRGLEHGVVDDVLKELGSSRSTFYRNFGSWERMLTSVYENALEAVNTFFPVRAGDRRLEFEKWWGEVMDLFRRSQGKALRLMRPVAMRELGLIAFERHEVGRMPALRNWVGRKSPVVAQTVWVLALMAGAEEDPTRALELRDEAWSLVGLELTETLEKPGDELDELDITAATPLADPLSSMH